MSTIGGLSFGMVAAPSPAPSMAAAEAGLNDDGKAGNRAVDEFLAYMKKTLAERMADAWLAAHGLDRAKLKAMKPDEREAVLKRMAEELKQQLQQATATARAGRENEAA
jgi:acyl-CoA reductase-like NAD-dependent aldehyde dehydrogenase